MAEIKKVTRWWWAWNFDQEEAWLNRMAEDGYALTDARWIFFRFEKTEPGEYIIRLEHHPRDAKYIDFMEELGAEHISESVGWNYYRRKSSLGDFRIFSDLKSRIDHLRSIERLMLLLGIANIGVGVANSFSTTPLGSINLLVAALIFYGFGCVKTKRTMLETEKLLHE